MRPLSGERVSESTARFEVQAAPGATDLRIIVARQAFDPANWTAVPGGSAWTVLPWQPAGVPLAGLGLADRTETALWWAAVWTDMRTGRLQASAVRTFTLVPRFANRVASPGDVPASAKGRLADRPAAPAGPGPGSARRSIELAAGYLLTPDGPPPSLPGHLRLSGAGTVPVGDAARPGAYLVQFADDSPDSARERIARAGASIVAPIGGEAYLVRGPAAAKARLAAAGGDPWIADFEPAYKLSEALEPAAAGPVEVTALLFPDADGPATVAALRALGAVEVKSHRSELNHIARFRVDRSRLPQAAALADVAWLEPSPRDTTSNDLAQWVVQSGVADSRPVFDHGLRGQGQIVMSSDSGIRPNHEMFHDSTQAITTWGDYPTHRKIVAYKPAMDHPFVIFGDDVDHSYHGTHTGGTIAGNPHPYSDAPWSGTAKDARLWFTDLGGAGDGGLYPPDDLNDLFRPSYLGNAGGAARISSNSWGSSVNIARYTIQSMEVDQFVWNHPDYLIAFANGNYGVYGSVQSPGTAKNVLSVGATGNGTLQNRLATFTSRGPTADGRRKPTVCAPGDLVTSSVGNTRYTYAGYSGTSMSTPAVAGAMALVRQYLTEGSYPTGVPVAANAFEPSAALLKAIAVAGARNDVISYTAPDNSIGYGRLTLDDVLHFPGDALRTLLVDTEDGLGHQEYVEYQVQVTNPAQPLKIALSWSDAPGVPMAQAALVNDLDLVVTNGVSTYRGNALLNNISAANGPRDSLNVEELVRLPVPTPGLWTVRVEGRRVLQGPQRFALCITGSVGGAAGAVAFDRFNYSLSDTLAIEVVDADAAGPLTVQVSSSTEPWNQPVTLTGGNGVFRGSVPIAPIAVRLGDGVVAVSSEDLVTVTYAGAPGQPVVATARVNVEAPTISNVQATVLGSTQARITWTTDVAANSRVWFGAGGALGTAAESPGFTTQHVVLLTGLSPASTYRYDVESATAVGDVVRDSVGGQHRSFTTKDRAAIALLMDDPSAEVLATWQNALAVLGWDAEVMPAAANDPPLVGNTSKGLRSYDAVLWQVGPDTYPPFSDAQRAAIDSLLDGGGRLLVTGHDIGYGLSDADVHSYSPEREAWLESGLKSRYYADNLYADSLAGVPGDPVSGNYVTPFFYDSFHYPDTGDNLGPAPNNGGTWTGAWTENLYRNHHIGMHWESDAPRGTPGLGQWGGERSRLVAMFFEWCALGGASPAHAERRTNVLADAVSWLVGHRPPTVELLLPTPGTVVTHDFLAIKFRAQADAGRAIASRTIDASLDGGATWGPINTVACSDSVCLWDLGAAFGGMPVANSTRVLLRARVVDDGAPALNGSDVMSGVFTLARAGGDARGPVLVAGSPSCSPLPLRGGSPATLFATFSDAETGGGGVSAAEFSLGAVPAPAGSGLAMTGTFGGAIAEVTAPIPTGNVPTGEQLLWLRGRDAAGNWGAAAVFAVPSVSIGTVAVDEEGTVDFLGAPTPNPSYGATSVRFGLARGGDVRLELFDLAGRRVRTLVRGERTAGTHVELWDGRDERGRAMAAGVYFVRLVTPATTHNARVVVLN